MWSQVTGLAWIQGTKTRVNLLLTDHVSPLFRSLGNPLCGSHICRCALKLQALPTHLPIRSTQVPPSLTFDTPGLMESDLQGLGHLWMAANLGSLGRMTLMKLFWHGVKEGHRQQSMVATALCWGMSVCELSVWMRMPSFLRDCSQEP